jgi:hypothetical protein
MKVMRYVCTQEGMMEVTPNKSYQFDLKYVLDEDYTTLERELAEARAEVERMKPVYQGALSLYYGISTPTQLCDKVHGSINKPSGEAP